MLRNALKGRFTTFDIFAPEIGVRSENKTLCGALLTVALLVFVIQFFMIQFHILLQRDGYSVHFKYIKNYYGLEYLNLVTGEVNEEFNYPFRFMITAIDNETGRLPPDLNELGEFKLYLWEYEFDIEHPEDKPSSNFTEILTQPCTKEHVAAFDPSAQDGEILIDLNWNLCPVDGQKVPLEGRLDEFKRSTLLIEF